MRVWAYLYQLYRRRANWLLLSFIFLGITWLAGAALLATSGWFITACAMAGLGLIANFNIFTPSTLIRALALLRTLGRYAERVIGHEAILRVLTDLRVRAFNAVAYRPARTLDTRRLSDVIQRLMVDVETLDGIPLRVLGPLFAALLTLIGTVSVGAVWGNAFIALTIGASGLSVLIISIWLARHGQKKGAILVQNRAAQKIALIDHIGGLAELISNQKQYESAQNLAYLDQEQTQRFNAQERMASLGEHSVQAMTALATVAVTALAWYDFEAPTVALLALMTLGLNEALGALPGALWRTGEAEAAAERLMALESLEQSDIASTFEPVSEPRLAILVDVSEVIDGVNDADVTHHMMTSDSTHFGLTSAALSPIEMRGLLCQRQPGLRRPLNIELNPGLPLVVYGRSGTGKTSLLETMAGELTATDGGVWFDGMDLLSLPDALRYQKLTLLAQNDSLMNVSIRQFLSLGLNHVPEDKLRSVLQCVDLQDTLDQTTEGLDYTLGVKGSHVSGGQARRLQLAALLLKEHALVLLDEPFRGMQSELVQTLIKGIEPWLSKRCCVIVTHDPNSLPTHWPRMAWPNA